MESGSISWFKFNCKRCPGTFCVNDVLALINYDFGMDLLEEMNKSGFSECFVVCYSSAPWGYLDENIAFIARKLKS